MTDAHIITKALGGKWHSRYGLTFCPAHHNTRTPALSLADGTDGRLLARCHAGCDFASIMAALRALGLVEGGGVWVAPGPVHAAQRRTEERAQAEKRAAQAHRLLQEAQPIGRTAAETYLRGRSITCPLPDTLRFAPTCWHAIAKRLPALVALVEGTEGSAVHRTYLRGDGSGKADVDPSKAMLGAVAGGAVNLSDAPGPLVVTEGIENALSLASGLLRAPATIWAALSTSGLRGLRLPPQPGRLTVAPDRDDKGAGMAAAYALAERAHAMGWAVSFLTPPDGADWNDVLTGKAVAA